MPDWLLTVYMRRIAVWLSALICMAGMGRGAPEFVAATKIDALAQRRLQADLAMVREELKTSADSDKSLKKQEVELDALAMTIPSVRIAASNDFTTVFPLNELHRQIFKVQSAVWRACGWKGVVSWRAKRWDMLSPTAMPMTNAASVEMRMMRHEYRGAAFNLSNASESEAEVKMVIEGMPGGKNPSWITVHEVPFTDTQSGVPVAAALPVAHRQEDKYVIHIPSGLTRQIWLTFHPGDEPPGEYFGRIVLQGNCGRMRPVPLYLKIYPFTFPDQPTLHLGGWDYTEGKGSYEVTPENRESFIRILREHFVDSPWAQRSVLPRGKHYKDGRMAEPPDARALQTWLDRWPNARNYYVFAGVTEYFEGFHMGTPEFARAVSDWINWWTMQFADRHIFPEQIGLLLVDEPHTAEADRIVIEYANVIRAAQSKVVIWEDPIWANPSEGTRELFERSDVLCPNLPMMIEQGNAFSDFYVKQRKAGRRLWFYSCDGPGRLLDPYSYDRMQQWFCWKYGAEGSSFWAFCDAGAASSWNEYGAAAGGYTPLFMDKKSVVTGKHMEAIREGIEDFEYLHMLRTRVEALETKEAGNEAVVSARRLLDTAADRVVSCMTSRGLIYWNTAKDRSVADQVRVEILEALQQLGTGERGR